MGEELTLNIKVEDLMDPFTLDWLEDPVTLPCCGRAVSRDSLKHWQENSNYCPCCKLGLGNYSAVTAPKAINLVYLVEQAIAANLPKPVIKPIEPLKWNAKIHRLCNNNSINSTVIGRLELSTPDKKYNFKTLLIPVIDCSGSMSGSPFTQVKYSLHRIVDLIYNKTQIITNLVVYADLDEIVELNTNVPIEHNKQIVEAQGIRGGTSFAAAFNGIVKVIEKHKNIPEISSIVIIFLTDGEDGVPKAERIVNVGKFKTRLEAIWTKKYIVHSVGFGGSHDSDFLNALRKIGTVEGAYRYADPSENPDCLSGKINSLLDVIGETCAVPLKLLPYDKSPTVIAGENDQYWLNLTGKNMMDTPEFKISVNNEEPIVVQGEYAEDENDPKIWELWYTYLIDQIANELLILSNQKEDTLDKQLHCELLEQRSRAILCRIDGTSANAVRLDKLMETLKTIKTGGQVNVLKLNDLKYEGQYATKMSYNPPSTITLPGSSNLYIAPTSMYVKKVWEVIERSNIKRCSAKDDSKEFLKVLGRYNSKDLRQWIIDNVKAIGNQTDDQGSNMLMVASSLGRCAAIEELLKASIFDVNYTNNDGYNALDLAILYGYWHSAGMLFKAGARPTQLGDMLLRTCLSNKYFNTGSFLVENKLVVVTDDMIDNAPANDVISWLSARSNKEIPVETAILKGMYEVVEKKLDTITTISWKTYLSIFTNPTADHHRVVELLLKNKKADADEQIEIMDENEKGWTFPLFNACEKGQLSMFKLLIKYSKQSIDRQNHKGTTMLWIACCNRHTDIVGELLNMKANPNIGNLKGDSPLIPSCQKGNDTIVDMLLEAGARLDVYNKNRDGPILICCRTGQAKILEKLFKTLSPEALKETLKVYAEIDGFAPLLAATELDKVECIKVCLKYGAPIEQRCEDNNKMIPGGTSLHLACYYGRQAATRCLVEEGADITSQTTVYRHTPIHLAIKNKHINAVRYLLTLPNIRDCMELTDSDGRIPSYYAKAEGNESMLDEFFTNKLSMYMGKLLHAEPEMEKRCCDVMLKYGQSLGAYEFNEITKTNINDGASVLSYALLNGNYRLLESLQQMNANFTKVDDHGVSPAFWAEYLGYKVPGLKPDMKIHEMINKIDAVAKTSMQNKMLTNLKQGGPKALEHQPTIMNALIKMSDGYGSKINGGVLATLKSSVAMDHSLLGFMDKLKNKKEFPDGEDTLAYLLWDCKINIIKRIATTEDVLSPVHILALYLYTGNDHVFKKVNETLMNWQKATVWQPFINCLYQALTLLEPFEHEVYRGVDTKFNMQDYGIGNKLSWNSFSTASSEWKTCSDLINQKRGIIFVIKSKTGRNISKYAQDQVNCPVCFLPATEFLVTNHFSPSLTALAQSNIRTTTFKIKEKDYERACNGEQCIIIELEEVAVAPKVKATIEEI